MFFLSLRAATPAPLEKLLERNGKEAEKEEEEKVEGETTADKEKEKEKDEGKDVDNKAAEPEEVGAGFKCPSYAHLSKTEIWKKNKIKSKIQY